MPLTTNRERIAAIAKGLGELVEEVVFVGGATTELYIDASTPVAEIRPTDDIDCIINIASRREYAELEERLRRQGFQNHQTVICRWMYQGIVVDVMPTEETILGFTNRWYRDGIVNAVPFAISDGIRIQILSLLYFAASKLEALFNRGMDDIRLSKDFEDLVFLLHYRPSLPEEVKENDDVKEYIRECFRKLLQLPELDEAIFCVLPAGENEVDYIEMVKEQMVTVEKGY